MTNMHVLAALMAVAGTSVAQTAFAPPAGEEAGAPVVEKAAEGGWRVSAGLDYRFRFKTSLQMSTARYNVAHPPFAAPQNGFPSRDEVYGQIGSGTGADNGMRRIYANGYVDQSSLDDIGLTWNWAADGLAQYHANNHTVTFDSFYGVTEAHIGARSVGAVSDDADLAGVSLDLARDVWRSGDFSLAVSLGGSYFPESEMLSARQSFAAGSYRSEVWRVTDVYDVDAWGGDDPVLTGGGFGGPQNVLPYVPVRRLEQVDQVLANETFGGGAWVESDLWLAEARLCLIPEWRMNDRFSLLGNLGVAVEYVGISSHSGSWMSQNAATVRQSSSSDDNEIVVQAILGLGARYAVTDRVGLSVMGEARLPRVTIDVEADPYEGEVELGTWSVGAQVEYCF